MKLPRGVRLDHGYVQVRLFHNGDYVLCQNFGTPSPESLDAAAEAYLEAKKRIREGRLGIRQEARPIKFKEARETFFKLHYMEYRDESTGEPRTDRAISVAGSNLNVLGQYFDRKWLYEIDIREIKDYKVECLDEREYAGATFNKHRMLLSSIFTQFRKWNVEKAISPVKLPVDENGAFLNPCDFVPTMTENKRDRVPTIDELAKAAEWCDKHDQKIWYAIETALVTALRKGDLIGVDGKVEGTQQKTGDTFALPLTLEKPIEYTRFGWNRLRKHMGWMPEEANHTTWHDLRHWAPTLLTIAGFSTKQIMAYTSHKSESALARYQHLKPSDVPAMLQTVQENLRKIRRTQATGQAA